MTWHEEVTPAVRNGKLTVSRMRFTADEGCVVEVRLEGDIAARGEGSDLFEALTAARRELEAHDVLIGCNGARRDVFSSPMLRQAAAGRRAYVLTMPRTATRPATVDIFAPAPDLSLVGTVDEQRAWFDRWLGSGTADGEST